MPPMITLFGNLPVTTAPAATMHPSPITVPSKIVALAPIQQLAPTTIPLCETP